MNGWGEFIDQLGLPNWLETILLNIADPLYLVTKTLLEGAIGVVLSNTFTNLNTNVNISTGLAGSTPQIWNPTIFTFIRGVSENVIIPLSGIVIAYVLVYELISMIVDKNNFHEFDTSLFIRYIFKAAIAVELVTHSADIIEALFEVGGSIVSDVTAEIGAGHSYDIGIAATLQSMLTSHIDDYTVTELAVLLFITILVWIALWCMSIYIMVIMYGRFLEIYLYMSVAPLAFSTLVNKEWGNIGTNYLRSIFALAFQGFLIMVCCGIYSTLILNLGTLTPNDDFGQAICQVLIYTLVLAVALGKTSSLSKSLFGAH